MRPIPHLMGRSVSYIPAFSQISLIVLWIANLGGIDLKFSGSIPKVNIDNPAKFCEVSMTRSCISKNRVFQDYGL